MGEAEVGEEGLFGQGEVGGRAAVDGGDGLALGVQAEVGTAAEVELEEGAAGAGGKLGLQGREEGWRVEAEEGGRVEGGRDMACHGVLTLLFLFEIVRVECTYLALTLR